MGKLIIAFVALVSFGMNNVSAQNRILFVTSNQEYYGTTSISASNHFEEIVVPYDLFVKAGFVIDFVSVMPTNLYGPNDNYHPQNSHVLPAMIRRFHEAKKMNTPEVVIWGTGTPRREFLYVDDLADACYYLMEHYNEEGLVNIGVGEDVSIQELAVLVADIVGYKGTITNDLSKPDGTPRKLMDVSKLHGFGWKAKVGLEEGIRMVYAGLDGVDWY